jgi:hypothetical protein
MVTQRQVGSRDNLEPLNHDLTRQVLHDQTLASVRSFSRCHASSPRLVPLRQPTTEHSIVICPRQVTLCASVRSLEKLTGRTGAT